MSRLTPLIGLALLTACGSDESTSPDADQHRGEAISVVASQVFIVTLQTVGTGEYVSPPGISSSAVQFLGVTLGDPEPTGPTRPQPRSGAGARVSNIGLSRSTAASSPPTIML